ncbi:aminotransferase class V-fold PLP-dependent enzyme, partial [Myxococcota bacterium]|nr:aminotransferase class V-fold PLP-dependent enzyme [Myxococcota bacterium]
MSNRIYNFSAGPCTLPLTALEEAAAEFVDYQNSGMSLIEMSHRGKHVSEMHDEALSLLRELLAVPDDFEILLLGGGATLQFSMIPMNLVQDGKRPAYVVAGTWAKKALADGKVLANGYAAWDGKDENYSRMPKDSELDIQGHSAYLHITTNETIGGIRQVTPPVTDLPLIGDMSSEFLSRP